MKFLRCISRYFRDARRGVIRNFSLSIASISCITITLIVVAISLILSFNVNNMTSNVSSNITIVAFLNSDITETEIENIKNELEELDNIATIKFKSKSDYAKETKDMDERFTLIVDSWTDDTNPLLDSYEITVKDINLINDTAKHIKEISKVETVNYGEEYIESVTTIFSTIEKFCIGSVVALVLVTSFLISNTIKLAIHSRKTEIEIMRLVGASNISIKTPFLIEGSFIGLIGSIVPIVLTIVVYNKLYTYLEGKFLSSSLGELIKPYPFVLQISLILLLLGLFVGMLGSKNAVKKYLKI